MSQKNDISIGPNKWIAWIEIDHSKPVFNIDYLLEPYWDIFWGKLETQCVSECCGIDAFGFWTEDIEQAMQMQDKRNIITHLTHLKQEVLNRREQNIVSKKINNYFHPDVFVQLIEHVEHSL